MPLKRSPQLQPLSREHHEGLLLAWKIRQGMGKGVAPQRIAGYVLWFWNAELEDHFRREEAAFHPALRGAELLNRMQDEHEEIEGLMQVLAQIPDEVLLEEIAQKVNDHIRFEERVLFPWIELELGEEKLQTLSKTIDQKQERFVAPWVDEFWTTSAQ
ncbi:MAG: hemerythrin domain-containing protein [Chitinophagaceae bacterium]|nr:MAG: hemerythrin domain-containing protein [Chitinophagaceae bacterium]